MRIFLLLCAVLAGALAWASWSVTGAAPGGAVVQPLQPYASALEQARPYALAIAAFASVSVLIALLFGGGGKKPRRRSTGAEILSESDTLFLETAAAMAVADLKVVHSELRMITAMAEKFGHKVVAALSEEQLLPFLSRAEDPAFVDALMGRLASVRGTLSDDDKRSIIQTCLWLSIADLEPQEAEIKLLRRIVKALGAPDETVRRLDEWVASHLAQLEALITRTAIDSPLDDKGDTEPLQRPGA